MFSQGHIQRLPHPKKIVLFFSNSTSKPSYIQLPNLMTQSLKELFGQLFSFLIRIPICKISYLETIIRPASEFHDASLLVEREILHVHFAGRMIDSRRFPFNQAVAFQGGLRWQRHFKVAVSAAKKKPKNMLSLWLCGLTRKISLVLKSTYVAERCAQ